jgi:hypothetical protein
MSLLATPHPIPNSLTPTAQPCPYQDSSSSKLIQDDNNNNNLDGPPQNPSLSEPAPAKPGPPPKKCCRRKKFCDSRATPRSLDVEALIAISVGFPMDLLIEEEIEANVVSTIGDIEQATQDVAMRHPWPPMGWLADNWQPLLCYFFFKKR